MGDWKGVGLVIFALILAAAAAGVAYLYLEGAPVSASSAKLDTLPVVVAAKDLSFATKITEEDIKVVEFPREAIPSGGYADPDSIHGQTTKVFMMAGEPVLASKLSTVGGGLSVRVPENMRASSVTVNEVSGVSGFVLPGDRVDVLCTVDNAGGNNVAVTKTILQDCEVLASGIKTQTNRNDPIQVQSVTLLVDSKGAEALAGGMHTGRIHLVLRNPVDHEIVDVRPTNTKEIMGITEAKKAPRRTVRRAPAKKKVEPEPAPPEPTYTIIRDGSIVKQKSPTDEP